MIHPTLAPWNTTKTCVTPADCAVDGIHMSLTNCEPFNIPQHGMDGMFCTCMKVLHLSGDRCDTPEPAYLWDAYLQLTIGFIELGLFAWMCVNCMQLRSVFKMDALTVTTLLTLAGTFFLISHSVGRSLSIMGHSSSSIVTVSNFMGSGMAIALFSTCLIVIVLSWQRILNAGATRAKELFSKTSRRILVVWALTNSFLLVVLFSLGLIQIALLLSILSTSAVLVWYKLVGSRLVKSFRQSESGKVSHDEAVKKSIHSRRADGVRRIQRLIRYVTRFGALGIIGFVIHLLTLFTVNPSNFSSPPIVFLTIHLLHIAYALSFFSIIKFVVSVRRAVYTYSTSVKPASSSRVT